jgi:hypothetical protein
VEGEDHNKAKVQLGVSDNVILVLLFLMTNTQDKEVVHCALDARYLIQCSLCIPFFLPALYSASNPLHTWEGKSCVQVLGPFQQHQVLWLTGLPYMDGNLIRRLYRVRYLL